VTFRIRICLPPRLALNETHAKAMRCSEMAAMRRAQATYEPANSPSQLLHKIKMLTGVVEVGLFCNMARAAYFGNEASRLSFASPSQLSTRLILTLILPLTLCRTVPSRSGITMGRSSSCSRCRTCRWWHEREWKGQQAEGRFQAGGRVKIRVDLLRERP
jgi:hypothetical protein